jgi:cytochrome c oxidase assembly protein subunit 15
VGDELVSVGTPMLTPFLVNLVDKCDRCVQFVHSCSLGVQPPFWSRMVGVERGFHAAAIHRRCRSHASDLLGVFTLLTGVELWIAVAHQAMAALLLGSMIATAHVLGSAPPMVLAR